MATWLTTTPIGPSAGYVFLASPSLLARGESDMIPLESMISLGCILGMLGSAKPSVLSLAGWEQSGEV